jgi:hypothetical protein
VFLARLEDGRPFCVAAEDEKKIVHETKGTMFMDAWKSPVSIMLFPEDPMEFFTMLVEANYNVLGCHKGWPGIREMTAKIANRTKMPMVMFNDRSLHDDKDNIYYFFLR